MKLIKVYDSFAVAGWGSLFSQLNRVSYWLKFFSLVFFMKYKAYYIILLQ